VIATAGGSGAVAALLVGVVLVAAAPFVYRFAPRLNSAVRGLLNRGALEGMDRGDEYWRRFNSVERVVAAVLLAAAGLLLIVVAIVGLAHNG
jgi:hypothetical protein